MATEEYSIGYEAGYQAGWNEAVDKTPARVPLTDGEQSLLWAKLFGPNAPSHTKLHRSYVRRDDFEQITRAIEAAHGIGGGK